MKSYVNKFVATHNNPEIYHLFIQAGLYSNVIRAPLILQEISGNILCLPQLPQVLWGIIEEYKGDEVIEETKVTGEEESDSWWCNIL